MKRLRADIEYIYDETEQLVRKQVELTQMELVEKAAFTGGKMIAICVMLFISLFAFFLLGIAMVLWLATLFGSYLQATLLVVFVYLLILTIIYLFKESLIIQPFVNNQFKSYLRDYYEKQETHELEVKP